MGCDIHIFSERREGDVWILNEPCFGVYKDEGLHVPYHYQFYNGRDYDLFAMIAGVRGEGPREPFPALRGFPADACAEVRSMYDYWGVDAHSASWLTLDEIDRAMYALKDQTYTITGYMPKRKAEDLIRRAGTPELRAKLSEKDWDALLYPYAGWAGIADWSPFTIDVPMKAHGPLTTVRRWADKLRSLNREARAVFWFDN